MPGDEAYRPVAGSNATGAAVSRRVPGGEEVSEQAVRFFDWEAAGAKMAEYVSAHPEEFKGTPTHAGKALPLADKETVLRILRKGAPK